jgi:hypothetical protein
LVSIARFAGNRRWCAQWRQRWRQSRSFRVMASVHALQ